MPEQLLPGETLVLRQHRHWVVLFKALWWSLLLLVLAGLASLLIHAEFFRRGEKLLLIAAVLVLVGLNAIISWIRWNSYYFVLTDQRVILNKGVFSRSTKIIAIDRVQDCSTQETLLGRILGYGRVEIDAAGAAGAEVLDHLPRPGQFRDQIFMQSERLRRGPAPSAGGT
ncbi:MAG TPA: PH domain-containing protein [Candidatus Acidoferrales bacterium]|nr:PH domain-containing protein [Candidatus Acidoferrales bacterium]